MKKIVKKRMLLRCRKRSPLTLSESINYKNVGLLQRFVSEQGKILSRRVTTLTAKQQRVMTRAVKSARILALLYFVKKSQLIM